MLLEYGTRLRQQPSDVKPHPVRMGTWAPASLLYHANARCTRPSRWPPVLCDHAEDQVPQLLRGLSSPHLPPDSRNPPPLETETHSLPADHSLRRNDDQGLLPSGQTRRARTLKSRSKVPRLGRGGRRFNTTTCWLKARFLRRRLRCPRKTRTRVAKQSLRNRSMARSDNRTAAGGKSYVIHFPIGQG